MKPVFFDVDTQLDFVYPAGALYTPGAEDIVEKLLKLTQFAEANRVLVISTMDAHSEDDREFQVWKPHCVAGTNGQQKSAGTILKNPLILTTAPNAFQQIESAMATAAQILVQKQKIDCFTNENLRPLLSSMQADRFVVYGLLTEFCLQSAMFGLLGMGYQVELVSDAVKSFDSREGDLLIERFQAEGGHLTTVGAVIS